MTSDTGDGVQHCECPTELPGIRGSSGHPGLKQKTLFPPKTKCRMVKSGCSPSGQFCLPDIACLMIKSVQSPRVLVSSCPYDTTLSKSSMGRKDLTLLHFQVTASTSQVETLKADTREHSLLAGLLIHVS